MTNKAAARRRSGERAEASSSEAPRGKQQRAQIEAELGDQPIAAVIDELANVGSAA